MNNPPLLFGRETVLKAVEGLTFGTEENIMSKKLYLAYGSNLNLEQMAYRCPAAKPAGTSTLKDYRLLFRGAYGGAVATVEPCEGKSVPVLLWDITPADEAALDRYEGFPYLYRKENVKVKLGGKTVSAMVYIMNDGRDINPPGRYYYNIIRQGYLDCGFNTGVLAEALRVYPHKKGL